MTPREEDAQPKVQQLASELQSLSKDLNAKFSGKHAELEKLKSRGKFFSKKREDQWQMPLWLWLPLVVILFSLFIFAMHAAGK